MNEHTCTFTEEREPSGRLITTPCLECGVSAFDALVQARAALATPASAIMEALEKCLAFLVRKPNKQFAYSRCRYCDQPWWDDKEQHKRDCIVPEVRAALAGEVVEDCAKVVDDKYTEFTKRSYPPPTVLAELADKIRKLKDDQQEAR